MKTSPWAKLMRRTIPYTIVYPSAIRAYTNPSCRPFSACWRKYSTVSPPSPHFSPGFYCGGGYWHAYCVALGRAPRRSLNYASGALGRAPCIHARLHHLATNPGEKCGLRIHHRHEFLPAPLDLEDRGALDHVPVPVQRGLSGDRLEVPDRRQRVADPFRVVAPRLADRLEQKVRRIVRQRSEGVGDLSVLLLVLLHPRHDFRPPVVRGVVVGEVAALDRVPGDLHQVRRIPAVRPDQADLEGLFPDLLGDQAHLVVVVRQEEDVGARGFHLGQESRKVDVVLAVRFEGLHLAALLPERVAEYLCDPLRVVVRRVVQDRGALSLQRLPGELRHHGPLERVDEAGAEHVVLPLPVGNRHFRVRRRGRDRRDLRRLDDVGNRDRGLRRDGPDDRLHALLVHEEVRHVRRLRGVVPVVLDDVGDLHPGDAAPGVRLLDGDQEGVADRFAKRFDVAGKRRDQADPDLFRLGGDGRQQYRKKKGEEKGCALHRTYLRAAGRWYGGMECTPGGIVPEEPPPGAPQYELRAAGVPPLQEERGAPQ